MRYAQLKLPHLMKVVVDYDSYCRGKIEAPHLSPDGYFVAGVSIAYLGGKAKGLPPKKQITPMAHRRRCVLFLGIPAKGRQTRSSLNLAVF